jgi:hypothetical protein
MSAFRPFRAAGALGPRGSTPRLGRPWLAPSDSIHHFERDGLLQTLCPPSLAAAPARPHVPRIFQNACRKMRLTSVWLYRG